MQATFDWTMDRALGRPHLKRRDGNDYMMRSEKRPGGGSSGGRRPRRPKRNWLYILLTILLLLILYPVGLVMLWLRKFRASAAFKMALSLITCIAYITLIAFAITAEVDNPVFNAAQARARQVFEQFGESSRDIVLNVEDSFTDFPKTLGAVTYHTIEKSRDGLVFAVGHMHKNLNAFATNIGSATLSASRGALTWVQDAVWDTQSAPTPSPEPPMTATPEPESSPDGEMTPAPVMVWYNEAESVYHLDEACDPMALDSMELDRAIESGLRLCPVCAQEYQPEMSAAPEETALPPDEPSEEPAELSSPDVETRAATLSPELPGETEPADEMTPAMSASASMEPDETAAAIATPAPEETGEETPEPSDDPIAGQNRLASIEDGTEPPANSAEPSESEPTEGMETEPSSEADLTGTPSPDVSEIYTMAPTEAPTVEPETAAPTPVPIPEPRHTPAITEAIGPDATITPTPAPPETEPPTPSPEPTETPTPTESPAPTPEATMIPLPTIKPIGQAMVWHTEHGQSYHTQQNCRGMLNAAQHTLESSIEGGFKKCAVCDSPDPEILEMPMVVWCGAEMMYHITDECEALTEPWKARTMAQAIEEKYLGCDVCKSILFNPDGSAKIQGGPTPVPAMPVLETPTPTGEAG